jgi:hypothetical protein
MREKKDRSRKPLVRKTSQTIEPSKPKKKPPQPQKRSTRKGNHKTDRKNSLKMDMM